MAHKYGKYYYKYAEGETLFKGRWRLVKALGHGGMSEVWRAYDTRARTERVIKLFTDVDQNGHTIDDPLALKLYPEYFKQECIILRQLKQSNVPHIIEYAEDGLSNQPIEYWLATQLMEQARDFHFPSTGSVRLSNEDQAKLDELKAIPPDKRLFMLNKIASSIDEIHKYGVVHRDIKPSNILIDPVFNARLNDFGIAKSLDKNAPTVSKAQRIAAPDATGQYTMGDMRYWSPGRVERDDASIADDLYAFAITTYEILCDGRPPFDAGASGMLQKTGFVHQKPNGQTWLEKPSIALSAALNPPLSPEGKRRVDDTFARAFSMLQDAESVDDFDEDICSAIGFIQALELAFTFRENKFGGTQVLRTPTKEEVERDRQQRSFESSVPSPLVVSPVSPASPPETGNLKYYPGLSESVKTERRSALPLILLVVVLLVGGGALFVSQRCTLLPDSCAPAVAAVDITATPTATDTPNVDPTAFLLTQMASLIAAQITDEATAEATDSLVAPTHTEIAPSQTGVSITDTNTPTEFTPTETAIVLTVTTAAPTDTVTPIPPTMTAVPPTETATRTAVAPTETETLIPPINTATHTRVPPTATYTSTITPSATATLTATSTPSRTRTPVPPTATATATLTATPDTCSPADFDGSGVIDLDDSQALLQALELTLRRQLPENQVDIFDLDQDGVLNLGDIDQFQACFAAQPIPIPTSTPSSATPVPCPVEDVNRDRVVDRTDVNAYRGVFGARVGGARFEQRLDVNNDNVIDLLDVQQVQVAIGQTC